MATTSIPYQNTIVAPTGGQNALAGTGQTYSFSLSFTTTPAEVTLILTSTSTGIQYQFGYGYVSGQQPTFSFTYNNKVYTLSGATTYFSALQDPTIWNDPNGNFNGFVTMSNYFATLSELYSIAQYQGRLAFFSDYSVQFWVIDPNPVNWQQAQVLSNIGTFAKNSVSSLGDLDVVFLSYTGIRSLRVRDSSLNAFVNDLGSPIDALIQTVLVQSPIATTKNACACTDPTTGRYWLFVPNASDANGVGKIYVLSYYPSNKIIGWSTYDPSYISVGTTKYFSPKWMVTFQGQMYLRQDGGALYQFGGSTNNNYDTTVATMQVPFFDMKHPGHVKQSQAVDADVLGNWDIQATADWIDGTLSEIATIGKATYDQGYLRFSAKGTHFSVQATCSDATLAKVSSMLLHFSMGNQPVE